MPTVTRTATLPLRLAPWSDTVTLDQIDPAAGIISLALSLQGTLVSQVEVANLDLAPSPFGSSATAQVALLRPDGTPWLAAGPSAGIQALLPATGQAVRLQGQGSAMSTVGYIPAATASADAALLVGTGQVTLPVTASARVYATGPGNMRAHFASLASADVSVTAATGPGGSDGGSTGTVGIDYIFIAPPWGVSFGTVETKSQTQTAADAAIGAASTLTFDGFDPALGVLVGVTLSVAADAAGSAVLENLDPVATIVSLMHTATVTAALPGGPSVSSTQSVSTSRTVAAFDGVDDLGGASATAIAESAPSGSVLARAETVSGAAAAAFRAGPVTLGIARTGATVLAGPGNLDVATTLQAGAQVTLTYRYVSPTLSYTDTTTGQGGTAMPDVYSGPVAGLQRQYIWPGTHGVAIAASAPDVFLHGGAGDDALSVSGGSNVLDGGTGSNFLTGATGGDGGHDAFFLDARGGGVTWSTLVNFHAGDTATIFGFYDGTSTRPFTASDGAAGYRGWTVHSEINGAGAGVDASLTFAGISRAVADAHWTVTSGTLPGGPGYLLIQWDH